MKKKKKKKTEKKKKKKKKKKIVGLVEFLTSTIPYHISRFILNYLFLFLIGIPKIPNLKPRASTSY